MSKLYKTQRVILLIVALIFCIMGIISFREVFYGLSIFILLVVGIWDINETLEDKLTQTNKNE